MNIFLYEDMNYQIYREVIYSYLSDILDQPKYPNNDSTGKLVIFSDMQAYFNSIRIISR